VLATEGKAEHQAGSDRPAERPSERHPEERGDGHLPDSAGQGDGLYGQEVLEREVEPHPEHQQDDADLGELRGEFLVSDVAWREGSDQHARQKIPHQRREPKPMSDCAKDEGEPEAGDDGSDEGGVVWHHPSSAGPPPLMSGGQRG
jgi:hypothetical protein